MPIIRKEKLKTCTNPVKEKQYFLRGCKMRIKLVKFHIYTISIEDIKCKKMQLHFHGNNIKTI
jgi:hypothetical protein